MERSPGVVRLLRTAQTLGHEIGIEVEESNKHRERFPRRFHRLVGCSNVRRVRGVDHAPNESILVNRNADRTALIAKLMAVL